MPRPSQLTEMMSGEYIVRRYGASVADYERIADEDTRLELLDGVLIMHSPANVLHEELFWFAGSLLRGICQREQLGKILGSRTPMILEDERRFEPDLIFVKTENLHRLGEVSLEGPADLVIEVLSPATRDYDMGEKRDAYASGGVPEYWIIDLMQQRLLVDRPAGTRVAEMMSGLYASPMLGGCAIDVSWFWQRPLPDVQECLRRIPRI